MPVAVRVRARCWSFGAAQEGRRLPATLRFGRWLNRDPARGNLVGQGVVMVKTKSVYDEADQSDGQRILVTRFWPRGISKAQGFTTYHSDKGADSGKDILAAPDTLGFGRPRICVQVKSQDTALESPVLDQLVGTMQDVQADQGLLVCWGGFKPTIKREASRLFFKVRLWDQNDLIDHFLSNYDKFDEDLRAELPLKRIWTAASAEEENTE